MLVKMGKAGGCSWLGDLKDLQRLLKEHRCPSSTGSRNQDHISRSYMEINRWWNLGKARRMGFVGLDSVK